MKPESRDRIQSFLQKHIKSPIKRKKAISKLYNLAYFFDVIRGRKIKKKPDLFDYTYIFKQKYFKCDEIYRGNSLYGISKNLKLFSNWKKPFKACIEHGVYFGKTIIPEETFESGFPGIITFSKSRNRYLREVTCKPIISIGPYIAYANHYISNYKDIKKTLGKTLIVFPTHSGEGINAEFDCGVFVSKIETFREMHGFKTVIVCLYYNDILLNRHKPYEEMGYRIVTAGRRDDPFFLSRLKSFINISDYSLSNSVGTHIGYCAFLGKGHLILKSDDLHYSGNLADQAGIDEEWYKNKKEVESAFSRYEETITSEQLKIVDKYWGTSLVKDPKELFDIFCKLEKVFKDSKGKEKMFVNTAKRVFGEPSDVFD